MIAPMEAIRALQCQNIQGFFNDTKHMLVALLVGAYSTFLPFRLGDIEAALAKPGASLEQAQGI